MNESEKTNTASLFPAYASTSNQSCKQEKKQDWLVNESFTVEAYKHLLQNEKLKELPEQIDTSSSSFDDDEIIEEEVESRKTNALKHRNKKPSVIKESSFLPTQLKNVTSLAESGISLDRPFWLDVKFDPLNVQLGSLDPKTIPKYSCATKMHLGCSKQELLEFIQSNYQRKNKVTRYFSKSTLKKLKHASPPEVCIPKIREGLHGLLPEYMSFSADFKEGALDSCDIESFDGISTSWKSDLTKPVQEKVLEEVPSILDIELKKKIVDFNIKITESVHDEQLWLDFMNFQYELFRSPAFSKNGSVLESALLEKQIAILDKALKHNPNSVNLAVAKLELLRNVKEKEELFSLWENMIFYHPQNVMVWQRYLDFVLYDVSYFSVSQISSLYRKCLKTLVRIEEGEMKSHSAPSGLILDIMDVFCSICSILYSCGHKERAVGTFQSIIEFNLFPPQVIVGTDLLTSERTTFFEPFWDSGAPRIGETNAIGWSKTVSEKRINRSTEASVLDLTDMEDQLLMLHLPKWKTWLEFEILRETSHYLPWRPDFEVHQDMEDLDDPDRVVTFDHISGFLFRIKDETIQFLLLCKYLSFLGVRLHAFECQFFHGQQVHCLEDFHAFSEYIETIFPNKMLPDILDHKVYTPNKELLSFVENAFLQVIDVLPPKNKNLLSLIWLRHQRVNACKNLKYDENRKQLEKCKRFAKSLLKRAENRNFLHLWNEYIQLEWLDNKREKASQTFETLLMSSTRESSVNDVDYRAIECFVHKYIELCLNIKSFDSSETVEKKNYDKVVWILSHVGGKEPYELHCEAKCPTPVLILRSIADFKVSVRREIEKLRHQDRVYCDCFNPGAADLLDSVFCTVYLLYFVRGFDEADQELKDVLSELEKKIEDKPSNSLRHTKEQILVQQADLLKFHILRTRSSLQPLQTFLYGAVEAFPNNGWFLYLLVKIRSSSAIIGPTRRFFYQLIGNNQHCTAVTWLFAIVSELAICYYLQEPQTFQNLTGTALIQNYGIIWKIRSLFEKAVKCQKSRHCVALWRSYIKLEILIGETSKAKSVFHEALQNCPWPKALYLDGVEYFPEEFDNLLEMMTEKQLRIRTPPEEVALLMEHAVDSKQQVTDS